MQLPRKEFIRILGAICAGFPLAAFQRSLAGATSHQNMILGWTTCLTYETGDRKLGMDYYGALLDEMKLHGMTRLVVMMESHGYFSPLNHGLAWPVRNEKLLSQLDKKTLNSHEETEFFKQVITKAHKLGIEVFIEIKYLGLIGIREGYPGIEFLRTAEGFTNYTIRPEAGEYEREAIETLHICCDNYQAHQYMRDKISDVLTRYDDLDGIVLEHPSYGHSTCYCTDSRKRLYEDTGKSLETISREEWLVWKSVRIKNTLTDLKNLIKSINPEFQFGFYSGFSPQDGNIVEFQSNRGHEAAALHQVGLDFIMPYGEGRHKDQETAEIERVIAYLAPMDVYLHTVIRKVSPHNYQLPPKGPEYVKNIIAWAKRYQKINERFTGMTFFNEVNIPPENRAAVYAAIRQ